MRWLVPVTCLCALLAVPASAQVPDEVLAVGCKGTFGPDTTGESLARLFGPQNVKTVTVGYESSGDEREETILFPRVGHSAEVQIIWAYRYVQSKPTDVTVYGGELDFKTRTKASPRAWRSVSGVQVMMTVPQLEALNGRPFKIVGDSTHGYASVGSWEGGRLGRDADGCRLDVRLIFFDVPRGVEWGYTTCPLCPDVSSADPKVRAYSGHVYSFTVRRPAGEGK